MKSSVDAFRAASGYNYSGIRSVRWSAAMEKGDANSPRRLGARCEGVFTIPVCYDSSGKSITAVRNDTGRNYPCSCGDRAAARPLASRLATPPLFFSQTILLHNPMLTFCSWDAAGFFDSV